MPISANGTLHDDVNACSIVTVELPPLQSSSPKFSMCASVPGSSRWCGFFHDLPGPQLFSSAALAVIVLKLDPGRYRSWNACETSGCSGSLVSFCHALRISSGLPDDNGFGSKPGFEYIA